MSDVIAWTIRNLQGRTRVPDLKGLPTRVVHRK